jgi:hypothetical protein
LLSIAAGEVVAARREAVNAKKLGDVVEEVGRL